MSHKLVKKLITIILLASLHTQDIICTNTIDKIAKPLNKPITGIEVWFSHARQFRDVGSLYWRRSLLFTIFGTQN